MTDITELFINQLLDQMTLDEKIGQLNQVHPGKEVNLDQVRQGWVGSLLNASGALTGSGSSESMAAETTNLIQQAALESRLKIPVLFGRDVIHGYRTIFPIPLAQAAAFDPDLAGKAASIAAREASASGIKWTFAPMLDIARDPRWGRVAEGNGEDPYLGTLMARSLVHGYQGDDMSQPDKLVACAKHFVGYGSAEGGRDYESGEISEPTLRDVYLPPFAGAVGAGVGTVMAAFLDLNGIPLTANHHLLTDVLRGEWGFDGVVVSDWSSVTELVQHGVAEDPAAAAALALQAGVDMDMVSGAYLETLSANLQSGRILPGELDEAVLRVLRIKQSAGLFQNPWTDTSRYTQEVLTPESRQVARQYARQCMVLLKNKNDLLPLQSVRKVLVAGKFITARSELFGTWSPDGRAEDVKPLDQAFIEIAPNDVELLFTEDLDKAMQYTLDSDAVVLLLGEHPHRSGENANLSDLTLPQAQAEWIDRIASLGKPVVLVVFAGRPLVLTRQLSQVDALLFAWHPGIEGGAALGELLFGLHPPSARLPITFPRATGQVPIYYNHKNSGRPVTPGGNFRTRYLDLPSYPLFPFGFGLSYTKFAFSTTRVSSSSLRGEITATVEVTNTGTRSGCELAQLYIRDLVGSLTRPVCELKGFSRLELKPGETRQISFTITEEMLAFTRLDGTYGVEPGRFQVRIAPDSVSGSWAEFFL